MKKTTPPGKIAIIGNCGSGKSILARELQKRLGLPLYHLDQYFWKAGWQKVDRADFEAAHRRLCDQSKWIIEGIARRLFHYRAEQADVIIFLNVPTYLCLYRVLKRAILHWGKVYFSSAPGCAERGPSWKFLQFVFNFNRGRKPIILDVLKKQKHKEIYVIKTKKEIEQLIDTLSAR